MTPKITADNIADNICIGQGEKRIERNLSLLSYPSVKTFVLGAQKNRLIETVLLSTHNICFG